LPQHRWQPKKLFNSWALRTIKDMKPYFTHIRRVTREADSVGIHNAAGAPLRAGGVVTYQRMLPFRLVIEGMVCKTARDMQGCARTSSGVDGYDSNYR
jgi:hypothetical protein